MAKKAEPKPTDTALTPHPLSDTVPGEMSEEEFTALTASVKAHGLRNPIVLYEGKILDGRSRYRAVQKLDVARIPDFEFKGTAQEAAQLVLDNNLHRRQLSSMQKAIVAARMCMGKDATVTQKDAAVMVGCGSATVNLAVRLLDSKNTPLIKRAERGDATRAEIDELLYDRKDRTEDRVPVAAGAPAEEDADEELEDMLGDVDAHAKKGKKGDNVVDITDRLPTVGGKRSRAGKVATETPASRVVQSFKALKELERKHFVDMAWTWLEPAIRAAGRAVVPDVRVSKAKAVAAQAKHKTGDRKAVKAKVAAKAEQAKKRKAA